MNPLVDLANATADQDRQFASAFAIVNQAIAQRVFPGAALAVTHRGALVALQPFGSFTYDLDSPPILRETPWDLASLTKPIATASMAMLLYDRDKLSLDAKVIDLLPEFADPLDPRRQAVTVRMLLAHSSGLPAHRKLYLQATGRDAITSAAMRVPLQSAPLQRAEYSDIGFILLGELIERIAAERLDQFCAREVFAPLKLNLSFSPPPSLAPSVPPTANDVIYRHRVIQGEVNDENASAMGGVAAHAGLFGDALSVARFAESILACIPPRDLRLDPLRDLRPAPPHSPLFLPETVHLFTTRDATPGSSRALAWDTPSPPSQSGAMFSPHSFGHLGYTGTSLWCDPERRLSVTFLTNRTWPDAQNQAIKQLRPPLHDAIVHALETE